MAKQPIPQLINETIIEEEFSNALDTRFTQYAFMSLEDRALPDARDGLKPSQRRVLVAMNDLNLHAAGGTEKCAKICGDTSGNYHPHGEAVVYPTMYRLAQSWVMREPLILGQGNFGNIDGDDPAAMRYTEAKLSEVGEAMLEDLSADVVPFVPNYNEKRQEPTILPAKFPNLLVNGGEGIAVGWATKMAPHNLREVAKVIRAFIQNRDITPKDVLKLMPGPDFPVGGKVLGQEEVLEYYSTGRGSMRLEGTWERTKNAKGIEIITVTSLPYQVSPEKFAKQVEDLVKTGIAPGISDIKNLSSKKTGVQIVIDTYKGSNADLIVNTLLKHTKLRISFNVNCTVLINGKVVPDAGILKLFEAFVKHRFDVLTAKYKAERLKLQARIHILEALIRVANRIDDTIKIIRASDSPEQAIQSLIAAKLCDTEIQGKAVLAITLSQLTKLEQNKLIEERTKKTERILWLDGILADPNEIERLIIAEQEDLAEAFGSERKTKIVRGEVQDVANEDLISDERLVVMLTGDGYVKTIASADYDVQKRGGRGSNGAKETSTVFEMFEANSKDNVMFFTNKGLAYRKKAYQLPKGQRLAKGVHVSNLLSLGEGENVSNMIGISDMQDSQGRLVIVTKNGLIKRTLISEYDTSLKNAGLMAIRLGDDDAVSFAILTNGSKDIFIVTAQGQCVRYNETLVTEQGRATQGSRALKLNAGDTIAQVLTLDKNENPYVLVVTKNGFGKKTSSAEYKAMDSRQVKGYAVMSKQGLAKTGAIAGVCAVQDSESVLVLTDKGKIIRISPSDINATGRATVGVRVVKVDDDDTVVKVARLLEPDESE
jgi:DNA gyrase subunit A